MHIDCSQSNTQITNTKLSTLEVNLLVLVNKIGAKESTKFGVFTKHLVDPVLTK
jgi:hypothetical protein